MIELATRFIESILDQPLVIQLWIGWLILINTASLGFLRHLEGRATLIAWVGNLVTMTALFSVFGYVRLLGLSHVLWWSPLLVYLWRRRPWPRRGAIAVWLAALFLSDLVSLAIDYVDVARYLLGDRT